jgi:WD40 repeat protein
MLVGPQLSPITATFGTDSAILNSHSLQLTTDGKFATDGTTWVDLTAEKAVPGDAVPNRDKRPPVKVPDAEVVRGDKPGDQLRVVHPTTRAVHHLKPPEAKCVIMAFAVSADGLSTAILTFHHLHLFDTASEECVRIVSAPRNYFFENPQVAFTPDGTRALLINSNRRVRVIPVDGKAKSWSIDIGDGNGIWAFAVSADGGTLAVKDFGGVVRGYDLTTGKRLGKGLTPDTWVGVNWAGEHTAVCWSRRGRLVLWDTRTGTVEREFTVAMPADATDGVDELAISPDGKRVAVVEQKHTNGSSLRVFDLTTGKVTWEMPDKRRVWEVIFQPDGTKLGLNEGDEFHTYDLTDKAEPGTIKMKIGLPCRFSDDGRTVFQLVNGTWGHLVVCAEVVGGKDRWTWRKGVSEQLGGWRGGIIGLHPADDVVWVANGDSVHGIDRLTGTTRWAVERLPVADKQWGLRERQALFAASRDDRWLAAGLKFDHRGDRDGEAFGVYDLHTRAGRDRPLVSPPLPHPICGLAVSPDGGRVIVLTSTGEQQVWDLGKLRRVTPDPFGEVWEHLGLEGVRVVEAMTTLVADPDRAVKLLAEKLPPVAEPNAEQVKRWLGELGSPDFKTRDTAERALSDVADAARSLVRAAADKSANSEATARLERILLRLESFSTGSNGRRVMRAVEVVERLRTPAAVKLLERWAGGATDALLTTEAKASLKRVQK